MPFDEKSWKLPEAEGLYNPDLEKDACGVGFIVNIDGKKSHKVSEKGRFFSVVPKIICLLIKFSFPDIS